LRFEMEVVMGGGWRMEGFGVGIGFGVWVHDL